MIRDHVAATLRTIEADHARLNAAADASRNEVAADALDLIDHLDEERAWLRQQPLSSLLDDAARDFMNEYRLMIRIAAIYGERYLYLSSAHVEHQFVAPADALTPWFELLDGLGEMSGRIGNLGDGTA